MAKQLVFDEEARRSLKAGVDQLADAEVACGFPILRDDGCVGNVVAAEVATEPVGIELLGDTSLEAGISTDRGFRAVQARERDA